MGFHRAVKYLYSIKYLCRHCVFVNMWKFHCANHSFVVEHVFMWGVAGKWACAQLNSLSEVIVMVWATKLTEAFKHHTDTLIPSIRKWFRLVPVPGSLDVSDLDILWPSATFTATARQMAPIFLSKERTPASRVYLNIHTQADICYSHSWIWGLTAIRLLFYFNTF